MVGLRVCRFVQLVNFENVPRNFETFGELENFCKDQRNFENVQGNRELLKMFQEILKMFQEILKMFVRTRFQL